MFHGNCEFHSSAPFFPPLSTCRRVLLAFFVLFLTLRQGEEVFSIIFGVLWADLIVTVCCMLYLAALFSLSVSLSFKSIQIVQRKRPDRPFACYCLRGNGLNAHYCSLLWARYERPLSNKPLIDQVSGARWGRPRDNTPHGAERLWSLNRAFQYEFCACVQGQQTWTGGKWSAQRSVHMGSVVNFLFRDMILIGLIFWCERVERREEEYFSKNLFVFWNKN